MEFRDGKYVTSYHRSSDFLMRSIKATFGSAEKWLKIYNATGIDYGRLNCDLCKLDDDLCGSDDDLCGSDDDLCGSDDDLCGSSTNNYIATCRYCPLTLFVEESYHGCSSTPYTEWDLFIRKAPTITDDDKNKPEYAEYLRFYQYHTNRIAHVSVITSISLTKWVKTAKYFAAEEYKLLLELAFYLVDRYQRTIKEENGVM